MARLISDIVEVEILNEMDTTLTVTAFDAVVAGTQRVKFCSPKWLALFWRVNVGAESFAVSGPDVDGYYTLTTDTSVGFNTQIDLPLPQFFCGTLLNTKLEWARFSRKEKEKLPFVWLASPTIEVFGGDSSPDSRNSDLDLWFVHYSDWGKLNADREDEAVKPLFSLLEAFTKALVANPLFESFTGPTTKDFPKFATETPQGAQDVVFDSTLSAVNAKINVSIFAKGCLNC